MVWKIAAGVFLGLFLYAVFACSALGLVGAASVSATSQMIEDAQRRTKETTAREVRAAGEREQAIRLEDVRRQRAALEERRQRREEQGIRCINGQEFQRIDNGWVQTANSCKIEEPRVRPWEPDVPRRIEATTE